MDQSPFVCGAMQITEMEDHALKSADVSLAQELATFFKPHVRTAMPHSGAGWRALWGRAGCSFPASPLEPCSWDLCPCHHCCSLAAV